MNAALTHRPLTEGHDLIVKRFVLGLALAAIVSTACVRAWPAAGQNHSPATLEGASPELDRLRKRFLRPSADVERTKVTVVVNDRSTETGTILVHDEDASDRSRCSHDFAPPATSTLTGAETASKIRSRAAPAQVVDECSFWLRRCKGRNCRSRTW